MRLRGIHALTAVLRSVSHRPRGRPRPRLRGRPRPRPHRHRRRCHYVLVLRAALVLMGLSCFCPCPIPPTPSPPPPSPMSTTKMSTTTRPTYMSNALLVQELPVEDGCTSTKHLLISQSITRALGMSTWCSPALQGDGTGPSFPLVRRAPISITVLLALTP